MCLNEVCNVSIAVRVSLVPIFLLFKLRLLLVVDIFIRYIFFRDLRLMGRIPINRLLQFPPLLGIDFHHYTLCIEPLVTLLALPLHLP